MGGIELIAAGIGEELRRRLPGQRETRREGLALLVATMLSERGANLMELAAALPRSAERIDMRCQWIVRVLATPRIERDAVMAPFAREVLARAAEAGRVELIPDQSKLPDRHRVPMPALRFGERALPLAWRVEEAAGPMGWPHQAPLLDLVAAWLPEGAAVMVLGDRFHGTAAAISTCAARGWDYRLRLKGDLRAFAEDVSAAPASRLAGAQLYLTGVELTAERAPTDIGVICDPGHDEPWTVAMPGEPTYLSTLDYARRWGVEPMFSDFESRGFGLDDTRIRRPDRLARLVLVMALALHCAVSTGVQDEAARSSPAEAKPAAKRRKNVARGRVSWFTRGLRCIARLLQSALPLPPLWATPARN